jgi:hypothetical protein
MMRFGDRNTVELNIHLKSEVWGGIIYTNSSQFAVIVSTALHVLTEVEQISYVPYKKYEFDAFFPDK